jgi:endonuclease III
VYAFSHNQPFQYVTEIATILIKKYGVPDLGNKQDPFEELVFIILSSKTPPDRYQEVFNTLFSSLSDREKLTETPWEEVSRIIARSGLQNRKAKAITFISRTLKEKFGKVTLDPLFNLSDDEATRFLTTLPEVNIKTARCVLMYSLNRQVFPIDSHCFRIIKRIGWMSSTQYLTDKVADLIQDHIPKQVRKELHVTFICLGREICLPEKPKCSDCPIAIYCETGKMIIRN